MYAFKSKTQNSFSLIVKDVEIGKQLGEKNVVTFEALGNNDRYAISTADLNIKFREPIFIKALKTEYNFLIGETAKIDVHTENLDLKSTIEWHHKDTKIAADDPRI